jgi:hypothetical protein
MGGEKPIQTVEPGADHRATYLAKPEQVRFGTIPAPG